MQFFDILCIMGFCIHFILLNILNYFSWLLKFLVPLIFCLQGRYLTCFILVPTDKYINSWTFEMTVSRSFSWLKQTLPQRDLSLLVPFSIDQFFVCCFLGYLEKWRKGFASLSSEPSFNILKAKCSGKPQVPKICNLWKSFNLWNVFENNIFKINKGKGELS